MTCHKEPYPTRRAADLAAGRIRKRSRQGRRKDRLGHLRAYRCPEPGCGAWHLTSTPAMPTPPRRRSRQEST